MVRRPTPFQSAPPRGGRRRFSDLPDIATEFQSAPPRRGRRRFSDLPDIATEFQSAPPRRGRRRFSDLPDIATEFQSAPPRRGRPPLNQKSPVLVQRFNPRPREGGDGRLLIRSRAPSSQLVSIRAPAKGATRAGVATATEMVREFQSAPPRRGRPRAPSGPGPIAYGDVSIRAPAKGATRIGIFPPGTVSSRFNPRPREGGDLSCLAESTGPTASAFQSAPPRRGRRAARGSTRRARSCFNPRPREGGDSPARVEVKPLSVSIRAPAKGATCPAARPPRDSGTCFNPRPPRRGRRHRDRRGARQ